MAPKLLCGERRRGTFNVRPDPYGVEIADRIMSSCHGDAPRASLLPNPSIPVPRAPQERPIIVAIVGPPNSGKSTLFNRLTGLRQKVANFPGVTVEHRMGKAKLKGTQEVFLVDLPGVYSLHPRAEDEQVTHDVLKGERDGFPEAGRRGADSGLDEPGAAFGVGRADIEPGIAYVDPAEHGG